MGHDLGRAVLISSRALLVGVSFAVALVCAVAGPATADDTTPGAGPARASTPTISPPSQQQIDDARTALDRLRHGGSTSTPPTLTQVAGAVAEDKHGPVARRISDEVWWTIGAGALLLLVASETTRISVRRAKHRKGG